MAQTDSYANLLLLIEALFGASFGATELTRIQALVNRRAWLAFNETDFWENQLVIGEERAVNDSINTVPYTGSAFDGTVGTTDTQPYEASVDHFIRIHQKNPWNQLSSNEYQHQADGTGARLLGYGATYGLSRAPTSCVNNSGTVSVVTSTATAQYDVYLGGTVKLSGFDSDVIDINGIQTVTFVSIDATDTTFRFEQSDSTFNVWTIDDAEAVKVPVAFCSYKKRLTATYGTNDTTAIPQEWFEYIAHGVMADLLRGDERWEAATGEENQAQFALQRELERLERSQTPQILGNQIATHGTEQGRQSQTY